MQMQGTYITRRVQRGQTNKLTGSVICCNDLVCAVTLQF